MSGIGSKRALGSTNGPTLATPPVAKAKRKEDATGDAPLAKAKAAVVATAPVMAAQKQTPLSESGDGELDAELMDIDLGDLDDIDVEGVEFDDAELDAMLAE